VIDKMEPTHTDESIEVKQDLKPVKFGSSPGIPGFEIGMASWPAVILVQEWWGVTSIVKQQAQLIAQHGFRVLIPDLYKGVIGVDMEEAHHLLVSLDYHLAVDEIRQAAQYLLESGSPKVGITGGCMGGALSFAAAQFVQELSVAVPLYGTPAREMPWIEVEKIKIPVEYHTGMLDPIKGFSDPQNAEYVVDRMKQAGCDVTLYLYPDTPHSFLNALTEEGIEFLAKWNYGVPPQDQVQLCFQRIIGCFCKWLEKGK
jgi:carboxymethylenebutenolidase